MTTRGFTYLAVLLVAGVMVLLPISVHVTPTFGIRRTPYTEHCGTAITAASTRVPLPVSGFDTGAGARACRSTGHDRLIQAALAALVGAFMVTAAWHVIGTRVSREEGRNTRAV